MPVTSHLPAAARRSLFIYNLFFPLVFAALLPGYLLRMLRRGGYRTSFSQRFGLFSGQDRAKLAARRWVWVHSISVGETFLALKLAAKFHELDPSRGVVLSATTSTGFAVAQAASCDWLLVIYNPIDARSIVRRTLAAIRPEQLIFIEAIWPNLLATATQLGIPTGFVPRLSPRSERRFRRFAYLTGPIFRLIDRLALADPDDVARWEKLGVHRDQMTVTGNAKFDHSAAPSHRLDEFRAILARCGVPPDAPVLLGGSTFPGEEKILVETLLQLRTDFPDLALVLVPRHVERASEIIESLSAFNLPIFLRSQADPASNASDLRPPEASILLVDTTGELRDWYHLATVVFIGKSLTAIGGQNPVEPVLAGKPVLFGPHMENFEPLASRWVATDAAVRIEGAGSLGIEVASLLRDPARRTAMATRARSLAAFHEGATLRTARCLLGTVTETPCQPRSHPADSRALPERPYRPEA